MDDMTDLSENSGMADRTFAERLRAAIEADPDLTPSSLAVAAGLDNSTIRQLLSGKANNPRVDTAMKICAALGTTLEEFLGVEYDPVQREIVRLYTRLSAEERRLLLGAAQGIAALRDQ